ncbi:Fpg/Nei family DNA glycosylase [Nocardia sp. NPDC058058]|uniref:Fpg/Nei family DNA glycosylase n=1 Tax=Nocardia sp. NPDC058058 TaxID=3346317 RepID=UPI0036DC4FD9
MPEGHTLHRLAKLHQQRLAGAPVRVSSPQGRFAAEAARLDGRVLTHAEAWGKHLLHHYDSGLAVHIHLGLYGKFYESPVPMGEPVGEVRLRMYGPGRKDTPYGIDLRGPNTCEILLAPEIDALTARLGPDPLRGDADPDRAWHRISRSQRAIGSMLMDQKVIAGVGNVYRAEVLFRHGISPTRPGKQVSHEEWQAIWTDLVALMKVGVKRGVMVVVRPEDDHGAPSYSPDRPRTYVYRRAGDPCRLCTTTVLHSVMEGRNLFWCPTCQPS